MMISGTEALSSMYTLSAALYVCMCVCVHVCLRVCVCVCVCAVLSTDHVTIERQSAANVTSGPAPATE